MCGSSGAGHWEMIRPPEQVSLPQLVGGPEAGYSTALSLAGRPLSIQASTAPDLTHPLSTEDVASPCVPTAMLVFAV